MTPVDLTIILPMRNVEPLVAAMVRQATTMAESTELSTRAPAPLRYEVLAVDEGSGDNTLSILALLHTQHPNLRTLQDIGPGAAIQRAATVARGEVWLIFDKPVAMQNAVWAVRQVFSGHRAALIPGEILAVERVLGHRALMERRGGLVSAQASVTATMKRDLGTRPAWSPASERTLRERATLQMRAHMAKVGLARFDRPFVFGRAPT